MTQQEEKIIEKFKELATREAKNIVKIYNSYDSITQRIKFRDSIHNIHYGYFMAISTINSANNYQLGINIALLDKEMYKIVDDIIKENFPKENG